MRRTDQRRAAVFICYQRDVTGAAVEDLIVRPSPSSGDEKGGAQTLKELGAAPATPSVFTRELVEGVDATRDELDEVIEEHAIGWHVDRIAPLERAILRVALYEIVHRPDVPDEVAVDEAVELAKHYCGADTPAFVNGILGGVLRRVHG
jgi:N utilization substance protein B